ncbi:MAG: PorT family protein [Bacteroidales bacterium]|nr:PorT family protein [Bacteroidales bacterium]
MKKIFLIIILAMIATGTTMAQGIGMDGGFSKSEYRYWNFVAGFNLGIGGTMGSSSPDLYIKTNDGDFAQDKKGFTITPGYHVGIVYNYDFLNNRMGVVAGAEFIYYGVKNVYKSQKNKMKVKATYRAMGVAIPVLFKFSSSDIYRDMKYVCVGVKPIINLNVKQKQEAVGWNAADYGGVVDDKDAFAMAATFGFNYSMFSFNIDYMFKEFVKSDDFKGHIFICTSFNLPMTRWLCIHNWTAEKIRRKIKGKNGM